MLSFDCSHKFRLVHIVELVCHTLNKRNVYRCKIELHCVIIWSID